MAVAVMLLAAGFSAAAPSSAAAANCQSETVTIIGTPGPDEIVGTPGRDVIAAWANVGIVAIGSTAAAAVVGAVVAGLWGAAGWMLGRSHDREAHSRKERHSQAEG